MEYCKNAQFQDPSFLPLTFPFTRYFVPLQSFSIIMAHKAGFINIIGNPNAGKSTLMNLLVKENMSIITSKAQTTRHRILGILNGDNYQMVFSDTPGIVKPGYKLHEGMMQAVNTALVDADVILLVTDVTENELNDNEIMKRIQKTSSKVIVALNKTDLVNDEVVFEAADNWKKALPNAEIVPISALKARNTNTLFDLLLNHLPEGPPYYPAEDLTDRPERFFVSEIIREKIFLNYKQEIPYSCEVVIESYKETEAIVRISAIIFVSRESQKGIVIGHKGSGLKKVGTQARKDIEKFLNHKVFLELFVKVDKDWRDKEEKLRKFGYLN